jgi:LPXTG-motif cell wall-anchored protein
MARARTSPRPIAGLLFIIAGALTLLALLLFYVAPGSVPSWLSVLTFLALGAGFLLMALSKSMNTLERVAFIVGAVGWLLLVLNSVAGVLGGLVAVALILALVGSLAVGILVWMHSTFTRRTNLWFLIAMIITAIYVLNLLLGFATGATNTLVVLLFGVALAVAGFFIVRRK